MYRIMRDADGTYFVEQDMGSTWHSDWTRCSPYFGYSHGAKKWVWDKKPSAKFERTKPRPIQIGTMY